MLILQKKIGKSNKKSQNKQKKRKFFKYEN